MPDNADPVNLIDIFIDPTDLKAKDLPILAQLLVDFKKNHDMQVLSAKGSLEKPIPVTVHGVPYAVKLKYSISKPYVQSKGNESDEFYVRTKEKLGEGEFGVVKKPVYRLKLQSNHIIRTLPGLMVYKRIKIISKETEIAAQNEVDMLNKRYDLNIQLIKKQNDQNKSVHFFAPFIPGVVLRRIRKKGEINEIVMATTATEISKNLCFATQQYRELDTMHRKRKIAHLDIKSANIIITPHNQLRHIDYGFGQDLEKEFLYERHTGIYSDPALPKPKIANALKENNNQEPSMTYPMNYLPKADMYSSGIVFCEMMTGKSYDAFIDHKRDQAEPKLNKGMAIKLLKNVAPSNVFLTNILVNFFNNLTQNSPENRLDAHQAEMMMALLTSKLFAPYLAKPSSKPSLEIKTEELKKYSLHDLFYLAKYCREYLDKDESKNILAILFHNDNNQSDLFSNGIRNYNENIASIYQNKISTQLNELADRLQNRISSGNEKSQAILNLVTFIKKNTTYDNENFNRVVELIEQVLLRSIDFQADKIKGSTVIATVLNTVDPFILEQISPAILEKAHLFKANSFVSGAVQLFRKVTEGKVQNSPKVHDDSDSEGEKEGEGGNVRKNR